MSEHIIHTWRDPYEMGFSTCRPKQITIQSGITVLVGCNGAGKTTLLKNIESELKKENIPCYTYDNLKHGTSSFSLNEALHNNNIGFVASAWSSSEGENITLNVGNLFPKLKEFMETGRIETRQTRLEDIFRKTPYEMPTTNERWLLFDAVDSGYSIDNVIDLKYIFDKLIKDGAKHGYDIYIVISANEYELAAESNCLDVTNGKYLRFPTYDDFKKFILASRKKKDKRYERLEKRSKPERR